MKTILLTTVLAVAVGLTAAIIGTVATGNYLTRYATSLQDSDARVLDLSSEKPRPLPGTYEEALENARKTVSPALVRFYPLPSNEVISGAEVGLGVIVTSDGWVATTKEAIGEAGLLRVAYVGDSAYEIKQRFDDPLTSLVMVDLEANGLPVVPFGASDQVEGGDLAFAAVGATAILPTAVVSADHWIAKVSVNPGEQFTTDFQLADGLAKPGTPVVNSSGELIALQTIPLHHILPVIRSVIRSGEIGRTTLNASVIDLHLVKIDDALSRGFSRGAYVSLVTPSANAGLKKGDIIVRFGETTLSGEKTLAEVLTEYAPGSQVALVVDRAGEEKEITVELGSK